MQIRVLALVAFSATAGAAAAGRLVAVRPAGDAEASVIELVGDRPLSFTTLRLASPPRVVVDVADADPSGVATAQLVDDGTVRRVAVAPVGTTARVVIELAGETEFNVGAVGSVVQVRVSRLAPLVAKAAPLQVPPPAVGPDVPPLAVAEPPPERRVALAPVEEASPRPATPPPARPAPAPTPAEQRQAPPIAIAAAPTIVVPPPAAPGRAQPAPVRAEPPPVVPEPQAGAEKPPAPQAPPSPEPVAPPRASAPTVIAQTSPPPATPRAETPPPSVAQTAPPAVPPRPPEIAAEPPRVAANPLPAVAPPAPAAAKPPPQPLARAEPRAASPPAAAPASPPAPAARQPPVETATAAKAPPERRVARAEGTASREEVERARASIPTVSIVASPPPAAAPSPATAPPRPAAARTRASITGIGFRPSAGGMVMVRSDRPLDYAVTGEGRVVVVHLRGAGIPLATNRLALDTRFFDTPVLRVVPEPVAGGIDLRIELRGQTRYELSQASGVLTIAFERS